MAELTVLSGLSSGALLQRQPKGATARVAGTASVSGPIFASVSAKGKPLTGLESLPAGKSSGGQFTAKIAGIPTGGPYEIALECRYAQGGIALVSFSDVYVGDLWLLAGQSNMEGNGVLAEAADPDPRIRALFMSRAWGMARDPLHFLKESPDKVHNAGEYLAPAQAAKAKKTAIKGGGLGMWFGHEMLARTGVPQGFVCVAHGGTSMDQWSPALADKGPESLYGSMLESVRVAAQPFAGVLWYQGCNDTQDSLCAAYTEKMINLVSSIRRDLKQPRLPWIMAQLARETGRKWMQDAWNSVTWQQEKLVDVIDNLEVVATADLEMDDWIHVSTLGHRTLATRFALAAERLVLKNPEAKPMPRAVSARFVKDPAAATIEVTLKNVSGGLTAHGRPLGWTLVDAAGADKHAVFQVRYKGNKAYVKLTTDEIGGCQIRHGGGSEPEINTYDGRGMPVPVFGPLPIANLPPISPWFRAWSVSPLDKGEDISGLPCPKRADYPKVKTLTFPDWWKVDVSAAWKGKKGNGAFFAPFTLGAAFDGELLTGFDGPISIWIDGKPIYRKLTEPWPFSQDAVSLPLRLAAGKHEVAIRLSTAAKPLYGYGFFFRLRGKDGSSLEIVL